MRLLPPPPSLPFSLSLSLHPFSPPLPSFHSYLLENWFCWFLITQISKELYGLGELGTLIYTRPRTSENSDFRLLVISTRIRNLHPFLSLRQSKPEVANIMYVQLEPLCAKTGGFCKAKCFETAETETWINLKKHRKFLFNGKRRLSKRTLILIIKKLYIKKILINLDFGPRLQVCPTSFCGTCRLSGGPN